MNAGPTAERVYETLRRAIMDRGFRPGDRLDPAVLAADLNSSTTPVREALDRLVGEELVESRTGSGFHLPAVDEPGLKDMYAWSSELLALSLRSWPAGPTPILFAGESDREEPITRQTARLFAAIADASLNREHGRAMRRLNARLHAMRSIEPLLIADSPGQVGAIEVAARAGDRMGLRRTIAAYHRPRIHAAAALVRALYRAR